MEKKRMIITVSAVLAALTAVFLPGFSELHKLKDENDQLEKRIAILEQGNDRLKEELSKLRKDPDYIEEKARNKLGIVRKGEIIYQGSGSK